MLGTQAASGWLRRAEPNQKVVPLSTCPKTASQNPVLETTQYKSEHQALYKSFVKMTSPSKNPNGWL